MTFCPVTFVLWLSVRLPNFAAENFSLNRFRIIETHLYINLLWSVVIFIRYVLRIQYTLMWTFLMRSNKWLAREPHILRSSVFWLCLLMEDKMFVLINFCPWELYHSAWRSRPLPLWGLGYIWSVLCCLAPFSTIFQLYSGCRFYLWVNQSTRRKITDRPQVTDKTLSHNVVHLGLSRILTHHISGERHRLHR